MLLQMETERERERGQGGGNWWTGERQEERENKAVKQQTKKRERPRDVA